MTTGTIKSEELIPGVVQVSWTTDKFSQEVDEADYFISPSFNLAGQVWRLSLVRLKRDGSHFEFNLSRKIISEESSPASLEVFWNGGMLDTNGVSHYSHSGFTRWEETIEKWKIEAEWPGPEYAHLCRQKDFFTPEDKLTIIIQFRLDSACAQTDAQHAASVESSADDVVICVEENMFHVPRSILEAVSEVLSNEIQCSKRNGKKRIMYFPDCDPKAFEFFISFAYSNELGELTWDVIKDVYHIADKFDVRKLKEACVRQLLYFLDVCCVCDVLEIAVRYNDEVLKEKATEYFLKHFQEVLHSSKWHKFLLRHTTFANDLILRYLDKRD